MNLHYIRNALRSFSRHPGFSLINMAGLSLALVSSLLIILFVLSEKSFDRFHKKGEHIYRVYMRQPGNLVAGSSSDSWVVSPAILKPTWEKELPGIGAITRTVERKWVLHHEESFIHEQVLLVDPEFFEVFTFPLRHGNSTDALRDPFSMLISPEMALKYFGEENPLGRSMLVNDSIRFTITGVLDELPPNSHLQFHILVPLQCLEIMEGRSMIHPDWTYNNSFATYLTLHKNIDVEEFDVLLRRYDVDGFNDTSWSFHLQPLYDIHFNRATGGGGNRVALYIFVTVGFFILFIACFNYMNLSIVHQRARIRGVTLRKVMGADKGSFMRQFFAESFLLLLLATLAAMLVVRMVLPWFNAVLELNLQYRMLWSLPMLLITLTLILTLALISAAYPALYLARLPLPGTLKGGLSKLTGRGGYLRKVMVVIQFSITVALILASLTIYRQLKYIDQNDPGYLTENILYIRLNVWAGINWQEMIPPFKTDLLSYPGIEAVAASTGVPTRIGWSNVPDWEGRDEEDRPFFYRLAVDYDFFDLYGIRINEGRDFSREMGSDDGRAYIINREAADRMGVPTPLGLKFGFREQVGIVVGLVGDFHFESLHKPITPLGIGLDENRYFTYISIRLKGESNGQAMAQISESWKRFAPGQPLDYTFMDSRMEELYRKDRQLSVSMMVISLMALFISCLGIFGLISFSLRERIREMGIRKVLGAAPVQMAIMLTREIVLIIVLASLIGGTGGWYASRAWLSNFSSRFDMGIDLVLASMMIALLMAILPLGYRIAKSVMANPVNALRTE